MKEGLKITPAVRKRENLWQSSLVITAARLFASFCALLLTWLIARRSLEDLGVFRTLFVFFLICDFLPLMGLQSWLYREIAVRPQQTQKYLFHSVLLGLGFSSLGMVVLFLLAQMGGYSAPVREGLLVLIFALPAAAGYVCGISALVGLSQGTTFGLVQAGETILRMILSILLILQGAPILWIVGVFVVVRWGTVAALWSLVSRRAHFTQKWIVDPAFFREMLRQVPVFAGIAGLALVVRFAAALIIPWALGDEAAGEFGAAYMLIDLILLVPTAFVTVLVPRFSTQAVHSLTALQETSACGVKAVLLFILPAVTLLALQAPVLVSLLFGDAEPSPSAVAVMRTLIWTAALLSVDQLLAAVMISAKRPDLDLRTLLVGAVALVCFLFLGIPRGGVVGASVAVLCGVGVLLLARLFLLRRVARATPSHSLFAPLLLFWRPFLATGGMVLVLFSLSSWNWIATSLLAALSYLLLLCTFGALSKKERLDYQKLLAPEAL